MDEQGDLEIQDETEEVPESPAEPPKSKMRSPRETPAPGNQAKRPMASSSVVVSLPTPSTPQRPRPGSDDERLKRQEERKRTARAAVLLQRTWRGHVVRRDRAQLESSIVSLQSLMRGYLLRMRHAEKLLNSVEGNAEPLEDRDKDSEQYEDAQEDLNSAVDENGSSLRDQFYEDLRDYVDVSGAKIELHPVIKGRRFELWDLFSIATQQDCAAEDRDWEQIAQRLGFHWMSPTGCARDLKECYDRNLAEFEEAMGSFDDQDGTAMAEDEQMSRDDEDQALVHTSDAVTAPKQPYPAPLSPTYRSSSPIAGVKRSFQQSNDPQSELSYPSDRSSKRRRRDREIAIPQTPEHKLGFSGSSKNSSSRAAVRDSSSPLKPRTKRREPKAVYSAEDADAFLDNGIHYIHEIDQLPDPAPARNRRFIEPETQDFGLAMGCEDDVRQSIERDDIGDKTDEDDISPSQQLRSELDAYSSPARPVPIRGNGTVSTNRMPVAEPRPRRSGGPADNTHTFISDMGPNSSLAEHAARNSTSRLKATKRSLPQQYQTQQAVPAVARPPASTPVRNGTAAPPPLQSRSPVVARPTHVYPTQRSDAVNHQPSKRVSAASTRDVQSSAQRQNPSKTTPASSAPVTDVAHTEDKAEVPDFDKEYVDTQFEHFEALGYEPRHIGQAMEATSLQRGPMTVALQSLAAGKGIPQNAEGVWTDDDDEKLRKIREYDRRQKNGVVSLKSGASAREKAQSDSYKVLLLKKHGPWFAHRMAFMDMMDGKEAE